jgi:cobyrinic acid a,c-diamide synthase
MSSIAASRPRLVVAGLSGDSGKTLVSLALIAAARDRGLGVQAFKKGPDYIDAAWLSWAAGRAARNLDTFLCGVDGVVESFGEHGPAHAGASNGPGGLDLVEGNRGLFDGVDANGTYSTAALATALDAPVVLVLNARKMTRTAAACVLGCTTLDPDLRLAGVILNHVAGERHESVARESIERVCGIPVLGALPRLDAADGLPGRHLGLVTPDEHAGIGDLAGRLLDVARRHLDVDRLIRCARQAPPFSRPAAVRAGAAGEGPQGKAAVTVGYVRDSAFSFYYPENLEALEARGATLVPVSSLAGAPLAAGLDGLYIGGGFPETHAAALAGNHAFLASLRAAAAGGLPIYAECGGLILLARSATWQGRRHDMAGVLPVDVEVCSRPQGHGYVVLSVDRPNPFFRVGQEIRGHEFHYSRLETRLSRRSPTGEGGRLALDDAPLETACAVLRGTGCGGGRDALVAGNVWASYTHVHAAGLPEWADGFVAAASRRSAAAQAASRDPS